MPLGGPTGAEELDPCRPFVVPSLAGDRPDRGVEAAVAFRALSDPSFDRALGVYGGVFFLRGVAAPSVSFAFSKQETKVDCAENAE